MDGLHRGDNIHLAQARCIIRMNDLDMFDPMTERRKMIIIFVAAQLLIRVQYFMVGAVTDRVDSEAETNLRGFSPMLEEFFAIHVEDAAIILFADIRLEHRGGVRTEGTVHKNLDRADAKPVIAEACAQTQLLGLIEQFNR